MIVRMSKTARFELALERLQPGDWHSFERLASKFLASEFQNLRTLASSSGDRGRDAVLFSPEGENTVAIQFSVTSHWQTKINGTIKRIVGEFPQTVVLIYVTNQLIGANADRLKGKIRREYGIALDVRDRSWFLERLHSTPERIIAAEEIAVQIVDPFLASKDVIEGKATALESFEARAAFVHLNMQWEDDSRDKGLTKLCFEALVRTVLRDSDSDHRLSRSEIKSAVREILRNHSPDRIDTYTDAALNRLNKRLLRHWVATDEFCLTHAEKTRLQEKLAILERNDLLLRDEIRDLIDFHAGQSLASIAQLDELTDRVRRVLEAFLLSRGEDFATAVFSGKLSHFGFEGLNALAISDISDHPGSRAVGMIFQDIITRIVRELLTSPTVATQSYLRGISDAYTLFAFLRETPDVQSAMRKIFSHGDIWLDTAILLPLFAETLLEPEHQSFTNLIRAAKEAGLRLYATEGVLEEVERHMNRSLSCSLGTITSWKGDIPFLYSVFTLTGRARNDFGGWIKNFRGSERPEDDLAEYLREEFSIGRRNLAEEANSAPEELRYAVTEVWHEIHARRRKDQGVIDDLTKNRLVLHDVENYLGVVQRRSKEDVSPFGYSTWWLTLDRSAFEVSKLLEERLSSDAKIPNSPVMSADFLLNYLAIGPARRRVSKSTEFRIPVVLDRTLLEVLPHELIEHAEMLRAQAIHMPERVVRREIRDALDKAKRRLGHVTHEGLSTVERQARDRD